MYARLDSGFGTSALAIEFRGTFLGDPYAHGFGSLASTGFIPEVEEEEQRLRGPAFWIPVEEIPDGEPTAEEELMAEEEQVEISEPPVSTAALDEQLHALLALGPDKLIRLIERAREENRADILSRIPPVVYVLAEEGAYSLQRFKMNRVEREGGDTCYEALRQLARSSGAAAAALILLKRAEESQR